MLPVEEVGVTRGGVVDVYTHGSTFEAGKFNNEYSDVGGLIHALKYGITDPTTGENRFLTTAEKEEIISTQLSPLMAKVLEELELPEHLLVIPVPSFLKYGKDTLKKPQYAIADEVAHLVGSTAAYKYLRKVSNVSSKTASWSGEFDDGIIVKNKPLNFMSPVLLVDDIYGSGMTLRACVRELRKDPLVTSIFFFAPAKLRGYGLKSVA